MDYIYLDIETCPSPALIALYLEGIKPAGNLKDPEKIKEDLAKKTEEAKSKMCVDKDFSEIRMIGVRQDGEYKKMTLEEFCEFTKTLTLEQTFVTFNGLKFDFPVIMRNIVRAGLDCNWLVLKIALNKRHSNHIDLMEFLCGYGEYRSLDMFAQVYLGEKKELIDFLACTDEELTEHNKKDLEILEKLHKKFIKFIL